MKKFITKLLIIAIYAFATTSQAQATFTGLKKDYTQSMDSLLLNINKAPILTGILYDRIMPFTSLNLLKENGMTTKSNYSSFIQSWSELNRASYNPTFYDIENLKTNIANNTNQNLVDIGIINTKMNYIDYGLPTQPSMNFANGRFVNISGINPFLEKQITIIAPLKERVNSGTITFRLLSTFILQQTGLPIKNLVANFGTATNYNLITNQLISTINPVVTFTSTGTKEFTFTVTFTNNTTEIVKATMYIQVLPVTPSLAPSAVASFPLEEDFVGTAGITTTSVGNTAFQGYNETTASKGVLEYRTYYNTVTNNGSAPSKIKKEIILLDGYDPEDSRKIYAQSVGYNPEKFSLYELMYYDHDNNDATAQVNLVEKLRAAPYGFDVTLVNFPNGADYIERNAMAVVSLLQRENQKLTTNGSTEKLSVIGPSMGGLISRYALAYMEKNGMNHNTKLWVSYDSPHLGANIPISAQENLYFYGYNGRKNDAKTKFDINFRSAGARQMLIEQLDNKHENSPYPTTLWGNGLPTGQNNSSPFRQQFLTRLNSNGLPNSNGFPQNLRKVAILNGTSSGAKTNSEGQLNLELAAFTIIKYGQIFGTSIQTKLKVATIEDRFMATPNNWSQTFAGKVTIKRVGGLEVQTGTISRMNINTKGSMDNVQGGMFNVQGVIKDEFTKVLNSEVDEQEWKLFPNHAFIPSVSALAFKNPNFDWSTPFNRNLVCDPANKEIPFDSYFVPATNEDHVKVTAENANWLINELTGNPQAPHFPIPSNQLTDGPSHICQGDNATFSFNDICKIPSPVIYNDQNSNLINGWSVEGNLIIVSSTPYSVTVQGTSNENNYAFVIATFQNGQTYKVPVHVGSPDTVLQPIDGAYDWVSSNFGNMGMSVPPVATTTSYYWTAELDIIDFPLVCPIINPHHAMFIGSEASFSAGVASMPTLTPEATINWGNCLGNYILTCNAVNDCGMTSYLSKYVTIGKPKDNPCTHKPLSLKIAPNPLTSGKINFMVSKTYDQMPCNYRKPGENKTTTTPQNYDTKTKITIYDWNANQVYANAFLDPQFVEVKEMPKENPSDADEKTKYEEQDSYNIENLYLAPGNYIIHVTTEDDETAKAIIVVQ